MGLVMNVQRFSLHDGPGIRTTAFLMGCNLRCRWCHNPESWLPVPQLMFYQNRCQMCGRCLRICERGAHVFADGMHRIDRSICADCDRKAACANACPAEALALCGREYEPSALVRELARDRLFYGRIGGATFSGGEALMQVEFVRECLDLCRAEGIHTCVDTAACLPVERLTRVADATDLLLIDLKAIDPVLHRRLTGADNYLVLENIRALGARGKPMWIRVPLIAGSNAVESELRAMARFLSGVPSIERIDLFPVLNHAQDKYRALGMEALTFNEGIVGGALAEKAADILRDECPALPPICNLFG